jgi:hypothetical protein
MTTQTRTIYTFTRMGVTFKFSHRDKAQRHADWYEKKLKTMTIEVGLDENGDAIYPADVDTGY